MLNWIPNALTVSRCLFAALVLIAALNAEAASAAMATSASGEALRLATAAQLWHQIALLAFAGGAITDFLDGWLARQLKAESRFGVWLDPIADKLLVGSALIGLAVTIPSPMIYLPAALIIARDVFMTWLRTQPGAAGIVTPSRLAKVKTATEMVAIGGLLAPAALAPAMVRSAETGASLTAVTGAAVLVVLLWAAAALSLYTGWQYARTVRAG